MLRGKERRTDRGKGDKSSKRGIDPEARNVVSRNLNSHVSIGQQSIGGTNVTDDADDTLPVASSPSGTGDEHMLPASIHTDSLPFTPLEVPDRRRGASKVSDSRGDMAETPREETFESR